LAGYRDGTTFKNLNLSSIANYLGYLKIDGNSNLNSPYTAVLIVPTGIGASIGFHWQHSLIQ
jgi:hypothetical protein